ncbi:hypothetical protein F0562_009427 [Nyssa sinensis]|uniref:Phytocyanin domain-containing protein n=1 Tax=Nyssa sinensis TaxID=561372 RepID=A0A5J4ZYM5_9ASTE|nr:hypothetical protein F0562_009427 [Nyssa sinensis]
MAGGSRLYMIVFMVMVVAALLQRSEAQTTYVVGDALDWTVPPGGPVAYTTWASMHTFTVGDVLVFNFPTGIHNVVEVTRAAFDACNFTSPISISNTGPANITLNSIGEHYYICTFTRHCDLGQKIAINVSATSASTTPQPTPSLSPQTTPTPTPSKAPKTYVVGDNLGWIVPPGGPIAYQTWTYNKMFVVGDTLVFKFLNGTHNVAEVTKTAYESCNTTTTTTLSLTTTSPTKIILTSPGEHFFTCTFPRHCYFGQQLAINVTGTTAVPPSSSTIPSGAFYYRGPDFSPF